MKKQDISHKLPPRVDVIGVPISAVTRQTALAFVAEHLDALRGEYICACNVHTTVTARVSQDYLNVQRNSVMSFPDGKPLAVVGRKKAPCTMEKVRGIDFMKSCFTDVRFAGRKHYFYGASSETIEQMILQMQQDYPGLEICGWEASVFRELSDAEVDALAQRMNSAGSDFIWIAIGAPRQEKLMYRLRGKVSGVMVGVGGTFNILAGIVPDAPVWMQNAGLEWIFRMAREPKRLWKRYLVTNPMFVFYLLNQKKK